MKQREIVNEYYDPNKDTLGKQISTKSRRPRLTLRKLNMMRKQKTLRRYEEAKRRKFLPSMYGEAPQT